MQVPILIRELKQGTERRYRLQPAYIPHPIVEHANLDQAEKNLKETLHTYFRQFRLNANTRNEWLWYRFQPAAKLTVFAVSLNYKNQHIHGRINALVFRMRGFVFVTLPSLRSFMFMAGTIAETSHYSIGEKIPSAVRRALQLMEQERFEMDLTTILLQGKEELKTLRLNIVPQLDPLVLWEDHSDLLQEDEEQEADFDGLQELYRTAQDLSAAYPDQIKRAYYREEELNRLELHLTQNKFQPLVLIGPKGSGRHSLLLESIYRLLTNESDTAQASRHFWLIDPNRVIAGMSMLGAWQKRLDAMVQQILFKKEGESDTDFCVMDKPIALLKAGQSDRSKLNISDLLRPYLERNELPFVLIATKEEWQIMEERAPRFCSLFSIQQVRAVSVDLALQMLIERRKELEDRYQVQFRIFALEAMAEMLRRHQGEMALPGGLIDFAERLAKRHRGQLIDRSEVLQEFSQLSGLRADWLDRLQSFDLEKLGRSLRRQLVGQPKAAKALLGTVQLLKAHMSDSDRPVATLLFAGPTGTGKTHATRLLCKLLTGDEQALVRFDMNEFKGPDALSRLVGSYQRPEGQLIEKVRRHPFSVLLFDEIEKADPSVINLLLQVLDEGRLTDSLGRTVIFTNSIIVMTSNAGADRVAQSVEGFRSEKSNLQHLYRSEIEKSFPPEFVNRIDEIVIFDEPSFDDILRIARLQIDQWLRRDGFLRRTTVVNLSRPALEWVARRGYQPKLGGRAMARQIEHDLTTLSADQLTQLQGEQPVVLDIDLVENDLRTRVSLLEINAPQRSTIVHVPNQRFYRQALSLIQRLIQELRNLEPAARILDAAEQHRNWRYYDALERLTNLQQSFDFRLLSRGSTDKIKAPPIRCKLVHLTDTSNLAAEEQLHDLRLAFRENLPRYDRSEAQLVKDYLDMAFVYFHCQWLKTDQFETVALHFASMISGIGRTERNRLIHMVQDILQGLGASVTSEEPDTLTISGQGVGSLVETLHGIHLFTLSGFHPIPIRISRANQKKKNYQVVRIYDNDRMLYDCRTGLLADMNLSLAEAKLLFYCGLKAELRKGFRNVL